MLVRELATKLGLDVDAQSFAKGAGAIEAVKTGLTLLVEVAARAVEAFKENITEALEYGDATRKASMAIGVESRALQELQYAAKLSDLSVEELNGGLAILTRTMAAAKRGGAEQAAAFKKAGAAYKNADGSLRGADEVISDIAAKFQTMPDGAEKTALAMQLFGRSGARMIPMLNDGAEGLASMREEARGLGLVMGEDAQKASEEINDNLERLTFISKGLWRGAIAPLLPAISELVKQFLAWRKANAEIMQQRLQSFLSGALKVIKALGKAFSFLTTTIGLFTRQWKVMAAVIAPVVLYASVMKIAQALGLFKAILDLTGLSMIQAARVAVVSGARFAWAWISALAPFIAIGAAITGVMLILDDLEGYKQGKDSVFGEFKNAIDEWAQPNHADPWWLTAIKNLVIWMEKALGVADELGLAEKKARPQPQTGTASGDVEVRRTSGLARLFGGEPTITRDQYGNPNVQMSWADRMFGSEAVFGPPAAPSASAAPRSTQNIFHVTQQPGENGEHFARRVAEICDERMQSCNEETAASLAAVQ